MDQLTEFEQDQAVSLEQGNCTVLPIPGDNEAQPEMLAETPWATGKKCAFVTSMMMQTPTEGGGSLTDCSSHGGILPPLADQWTHDSNLCSSSNETIISMLE